MNAFDRWFRMATKHLACALLGTGLLLGRAGLSLAEEPTLPGPDSTEASATEEQQVVDEKLANAEGGTDEHGQPESKSRLSDVAIGIQAVPDRPKLLVEKNDRFLGPGFFNTGCELPTGAVWRPSLWVFGTNRVAFQYFDDHSTTNTTEAVDRLDLFAQLSLTGTERLVYGVRPFDHEIHNQRRYTSYDFTSMRYVDGLNLYPQTLFFEGDFGELFPNLDPFDTKALDYGFSVGRQPVYFQDGMLINADILDAVSVTRNTLSGHGVLNTRATLMYAWDRVHRNENQTFYEVDTKAQFVGLFTETDFKVSTVRADLVYVYTPNELTRDAVYFGLSGTQRLHFCERTFNNTARICGSFPTEGQTLATGRGVLLFNELSYTPHGTDNLAYVTMFAAAGNYTSAARGVETGGPLSPAAGILFAKPQIGVFGAPLGTLAQDVVGGAIGYQLLWDGIRKQLTVELGARQDTNGANNAQIGAGFLYQQAVKQHNIFLINVAVSKEESVPSAAVGARVEWLTKF